MSEVINKSQMREIEELANSGHYDALIAYGADLYRQGIGKGVILSIVGLTVGCTISIVAIKIKNLKRTSKDQG